MEIFGNERIKKLPNWLLVGLSFGEQNIVRPNVVHIFSRPKLIYSQCRKINLFGLICQSSGL